MLIFFIECRRVLNVLTVPNVEKRANKVGHFGGDLAGKAPAIHIITSFQCCFKPIDVLAGIFVI